MRKCVWRRQKRRRRWKKIVCAKTKQSKKNIVHLLVRLSVLGPHIENYFSRQFECYMDDVSQILHAIWSQPLPSYLVTPSPNTRKMHCRPTNTKLNPKLFDIITMTDYSVIARGPWNSNSVTLIDSTQRHIHHWPWFFSRHTVIVIVVTFQSVLSFPIAKLFQLVLIILYVSFTFWVFQVVKWMTCLNCSKSNVWIERLHHTTIEICWLIMRFSYGFHNTSFAAEFFFWIWRTHLLCVFKITQRSKANSIIEHSLSFFRKIDQKIRDNVSNPNQVFNDRLIYFFFKEEIRRKKPVEKNKVFRQWNLSILSSVFCIYMSHSKWSIW